MALVRSPVIVHQVPAQPCYEAWRKAVIQLIPDDHLYFMNTGQEISNLLFATSVNIIPSICNTNKYQTFYLQRQ
jgi:hypothetical protein